MVQNLDFAQTFLEAAMIDSPSDMQGESLMPLLTGNVQNWDREEVYYHYYEYPSVHMVKRHYGIVSKDYKLVRFYYDVDEGEMNDRKKDPYELNNKYDDNLLKYYNHTKKYFKRKIVDKCYHNKYFLEL